MYYLLSINYVEFLFLFSLGHINFSSYQFFDLNYTSYYFPHSLLYIFPRRLFCYCIIFYQNVNKMKDNFSAFLNYYLPL
jgi:hypothetical protein